MKILILVTIILLTGCSKNVKEEIPEIKILPPADAMLSCKQIEKINSGNIENIVLKLQEYAIEYNDCKSKHEELKLFIDTK